MYVKSIGCFLLIFLMIQSSNLLGQENKDSLSTVKYHSPGGTYSDWYFPNGKYESIEWTFIPIIDPPSSLAKEGLLHYYAYNFSIVNVVGKQVQGGYAGFQTNGIFKNKYEGKVINFSVWGSNAGKTSGLLNTGNEESNGCQIMFKYNWIVGHPYVFELKKGPSGSDAIGTWWGLWVTDKKTGKKDFVGEQRIPFDKKDPSDLFLGCHTSMFGEDLHWWKSLNGNVKYEDCAAFAGSSMAAINISANGGTIKPIRFKNHHNSGELVVADNGFKTVNCDVSIYQDSTNYNVQHNLGYWAIPAPNILKRINEK